MTGFKTFSAGDVLTASDVNGYLMKQAVIICTSGTRPASPHEGMLIYETDTNHFRHYNGSAWVSILATRPHVTMSVSTASLANNTVTTLAWNELEDPFGMHSGGIVTAPYDGVYWGTLYLRFASQNPQAGFRQARLDVNDSEYLTVNDSPTTALNSVNSTALCAGPLELTAGDEIKFKGYQNSGGALGLVSTSKAAVWLLSEG